MSYLKTWYIVLLLLFFKYVVTFSVLEMVVAQKMSCMKYFVIRIGFFLN